PFFRLGGLTVQFETSGVVANLLQVFDERLLELAGASDPPGLEDFTAFLTSVILGSKPAVHLTHRGAPNPDADAGGKHPHAQQEEGSPAEIERRAALQSEKRHQDRERGEQESAQHGAQEGSLTAARSFR